MYIFKQKNTHNRNFTNRFSFSYGKYIFFRENDKFLYVYKYIIYEMNIIYKFNVPYIIYQTIFTQNIKLKFSLYIQNKYKYMALVNFPLYSYTNFKIV